MAKKKDEEAVAAKSAEAEAVAQPDVPGVALEDLSMANQLIHIAIKRGAYEPNELAQVAATYDKINKFLEYQAQMQAAARAQADALMANQDTVTEGEA